MTDREMQHLKYIVDSLWEGYQIPLLQWAKHGLPQLIHDIEQMEVKAKLQKEAIRELHNRIEELKEECDDLTEMLMEAKGSVHQ